MTEAREMPRYKCHKEVWALKIKEIINNANGEDILVPEDEGYAPFAIEDAYFDKHRPNIGGYYVMYEDGYVSYSPASAFESGYSLIE